MDKNFGKLIYQSKPNKSASIKRRLKSVIPVAVVFIVFGLFATFVLPHETLMDSLVGYIVMALGALVLVLSFVLPHNKDEADIFENGIKLKAKIGTREVHYSNFLGIYDSILLHSENPKDARSFQVELKNEKKNSLFEYLNGLNDFPIVADAITETYTEFLINNLTKENIHQAEIWFSDQICNFELSLKNGMFIFKNKQGVEEIPAQDITSVQISRGVLDMMYLVEGKEQKWHRFQIMDILNIRALYHIVHDILQK